MSEDLKFVKPRVQLMIDPHVLRIFRTFPEFKDFFFDHINECVKNYEKAISEFDMDEGQQ